MLLYVPFFASAVQLPVSEEGLTPRAEDKETPLFTSSVLPQVHVGSLSVTVGEGNKVTGSFSAYNSENATVADIQYELLLLAPLSNDDKNALTNDNAPIFDRFVVEAPFVLAPREAKRIPISYEAPLLPDGRYRLRVQLRTSNDRELGWADAIVSLGGSGGFIIVQPDSISVRSVDPATRQRRDNWYPLEGPVVEPGQSFVISTTLSHVGTQTVIARPGISTKRMLATGQRVEWTYGSTVSLQPGEVRSYVMPITAQSVPGEYRILLQFDDRGQKVSGVGEFRYVVRGVSASIVGQKIEQFPTKVGDKARIRFSLAGAADQETTQRVVVEVAIFDDQLVVGKTSTDVELTKSIGPLEGVAEVVLQREICTQPRIRITTKALSGTIIDTYETEVDALTECSRSTVEPKNRIKLIIAVFLIELLFAALLIAFFMMRRRKYGSISTNGNSVV